MTRTYEQMMFRHVLRIIIGFPLTIFGSIIVLFGIFLLMDGLFLEFSIENILIAFACLLLGVFMTYQLGNMTLVSFRGLFIEKDKKINYKEVYMVKSLEIYFNAGATNYPAYIATDVDGINYVVTRKFNEYLHDNGEGIYKIGIQEDAEFIRNTLSRGGSLSAIEIYSIHKKES